MQELKLSQKNSNNGIFYSNEPVSIPMLCGYEMDESLIFMARQKESASSFEDVRNALMHSEIDAYDFWMINVDSENLNKLKEVFNTFSHSFLSGQHDKHIKTITNPYNLAKPEKIYHTSLFIRNLASGGAVCTYIQVNPQILYVPNTVLEKRASFLKMLKKNNIKTRADLALNSTSNTTQYLDIIMTGADDKSSSPSAYDFKGTFEKEIITRSIILEKKNLELSLNNLNSPTNLNNLNQLNIGQVIAPNSKTTLKI